MMTIKNKAAALIARRRVSNGAVDTAASFLQSSSSSSRSPPRTLNDVPGPKPFPLIGNLNLFKPLGPYSLDKLNEVAGDLRKSIGPIIRLKLGVDIVFLFDPKDVATVFRHEGKYPQRPAFEALTKHRRQRTDRYLHMGLFTDNGAGWAHARNLVNPLLRPGSEDPYLEDQLEVADDFIEHLRSIRDSGRRVTNMLEELYKYTQEAVGLVCFGTRLRCFDYANGRTTINSVGVNINASVEDMLDSMAVTLLALPVWKLFPTPAYSRLVKSQENLWMIAVEMLEMARRRLALDPSTEKRKSPFLTSLLQMDRRLVDYRDVVLVIMELFQAGIDSTASAIVMTLYHLGRNPRVQQQLVDEIERHLPRNKLPTSDSLPELRFLRACIKEALRLSCPVGGTARVLPTMLSLSGHDIPAGTLIIGNHPVMSVMASYVSDPEKYEPERWLRDVVDRTSRRCSTDPVHRKAPSIEPFVTLPFSFGARSCPGRRVAQQEIAVFLIKFFQKFRCTYDGEEAKMVMRLNYIPDRPLHFTLDDKIN